MLGFLLILIWLGCLVCEFWAATLLIDAGHGFLGLVLILHSLFLLIQFGVVWLFESDKRI